MTRILVVSVGLTLVLAACGDRGGGGSVCAPGMSVACTCSDGRSGAQSCNATGSGYAACVCGGATDGGTEDGGTGTDAGMTVCTPGETRFCTCAGGLSGNQTCASDGSGFAACGSCMATTCSPACRTGFMCAGTTCVLDPSSRWDLTLVDLTVPPTDCGGSSWDGTGGAGESDPQVTVYVGSSTTVGGMTGMASDTAHVTYAPGATVSNATAASLEAYLGFFVEDVDLTVNDAIGNCFVDTSVVAAAFDGSMQTTSCPSTCSSGVTAGWGPLHWRLVPH